MPQSRLVSSPANLNTGDDEGQTPQRSPVADSPSPKHVGQGKVTRQIGRDSSLDFFVGG